MLYETVASIVWVNYAALFPELFATSRERAKASAVEQGFQMAAILIGTAVTPILFHAVGFSGMSWAYAAVFLLFMALFLRFTRERGEAQKEEPLKLKEAFRETLRNKEFWIFNSANSLVFTVNMLLSSILPFYAKYSLGISESQVSILHASIFVSVIPLVAVWYYIAKRLGGLRSW